MALSFAFHGLAIVPLLFAGTSGSTAADEPAFSVEISLAAPAPSEATGPAEPQPSQSPVDLPAPDEPPPVELGEIADRKIELPAPQEPPPLVTAEVKPPEPPKPQTQARPKPPAPANPAPARSAQKPAVSQTNSAPNTGTAQVTQAATAAPESAIVWAHQARFRTTPQRPVYPPRAVELGQQGEALFHVRLDPDGSIAEIILRRSTGHELLDKSALAAVRTYQFLPEMRNGHAVATWVQFPVRFHLR
jgi:protein TonB